MLCGSPLGPPSRIGIQPISATGNYTVNATFTEPKYMNLNTHPHPYGIFIGGNDLGTAQQSYFTARRMEMATSSCVDSVPTPFR